MLLKLEFDSGTDYLWTGYGDLSWDGQTWLGGGELLGVQPFSESTDITATRAQVTVSGIPSAWISLVLQEDYQGRPATIYFAALDSDGNVIADPAEFAGRMDQMEINKTGDTMLIRLSIESQLIDLHKPREFRYTDQDQRIDYPGDRGFEYVAGLQDKQLTWGPDNRSADQRVRDLARRRSDVSIRTAARRTYRQSRGGRHLAWEQAQQAVTDSGSVLETGRWSLGRPKNPGAILPGPDNTENASGKGTSPRRGHK